MFFLLSKVLEFLTTPLCWIMVAFGLAVFLKREKTRRRFLLTAAALLLFFTNPWIVSKVVSAWEIPSMDSRIIIQPFDVGIVMGGSMRYYDPGVGRVVYSSSVDRLIQAMQLYHDGRIKKIMLTGGSGFVNFQDWKESGLIAKFLLSSGIPESDIILENNSRNTYENAALSADILKRQPSSKRQLLITSGFHMRRSLLCFKKAGLDPVPFSVDIRSASHINTLDRLIQPDAECLVQWDMLFHEWIGIMAYRLAGYL